MVYRNTALYYLGLFLTAWIFFLLMAGGAVTSHEAGLSVPDWPLSYGQWFPPMVGNVFWEHGHRMIAGVAGILTLIAAVLVQMKEDRPWLKKLAWTAVGAVVIQAVLGGLTVLMLLPPAVSISHAVLGQTFFGLVIAMTYYLSPLSARHHKESILSDGKLRRLALTTGGFIYLQLILGAVLRHTGHAIVWHIVTAFVIIIHVVILTLHTGHFHGAKKYISVPVTALAGLTAFQFLLGIGSFVFAHVLERTGYAPSLPEVFFTVAHQSTGALVLGLALLICLTACPTPREGGIRR